MIITYFIPIGLMGFTYAMIGHELWGSQSIGECTQRQLEHIKSKRRVSFLLLLYFIILRASYKQIIFAIYEVVQSTGQLKSF